MKATKSKGGPKKSVSFEDWGSPTKWQRYTSSGERQVGTKGHITHYPEGIVTTGGHVITHSSHTEYGHNKGWAQHSAWTWMDGKVWSHPMI